MKADESCKPDISEEENKFLKPDTENTENLPIRLVLCLDGTGDTANGSLNVMNGIDFAKLYCVII